MTKLFCGDCGRLMVGNSETSGTNGAEYCYGNVDDIEYRRQIVGTFINAIYVYDDKLVFTYTIRMDLPQSRRKRLKRHWVRIQHKLLHHKRTPIPIQGSAFFLGIWAENHGSLS